MSGHFTHFQAERINTLEPIATSATSTTYTLSKYQSGSIVYLDHNNLDDGCILNLPPPDYGLNFKFIITTEASSQNIVNIKSINSSNDVTSLMYVNTLVDGAAAGTTLRSALAIEFNSIEGSDMIDFCCNGNYWYINGNVGATGKYTAS